MKKDFQCLPMDISCQRNLALLWRLEGRQWAHVGCWKELDSRFRPLSEKLSLLYRKDQKIWSWLQNLGLWLPPRPSRPSQKIYKIPSEKTLGVPRRARRKRIIGWNKNRVEWVPESRVLKFMDNNLQKTTSKNQVEATCREARWEGPLRERRRLVHSRRIWIQPSQADGGEGALCSEPPFRICEEDKKEQTEDSWKWRWWQHQWSPSATLEEKGLGRPHCWKQGGI